MIETAISYIMILTLSNISLHHIKNGTMYKVHRKADAVLRRDNVSARKDIGVVFQYIDLLLMKGKTAEAEKYLSRALKHNPWNLKYQLIYAEILSKAGKTDDAKRRALLVFTNAEKEEYISKATKLLGKEEIPPFPKISKLSGDHHCVVLIPILSCNRHLLQHMQKELSASLKIPVVIQEIDTKYPTYQRDDQKRFIQSLRNNARKQFQNEKFIVAMKDLDLTKEDLDNDELVIKLYRQILQGQGAEQLDKFNAVLQACKGKNRQWIASALCKSIRQAARPYRRKNVAYLGVTCEDIFENNYNYLFGWANRDVAVMSYHRFTAEFNHEPSNQKRLMKRTLMQCLASVGHLYGVNRCSYPTCARAYPHSLSEHDAKDGKLCPECKKGFDKVFGRDKKNNP